jgi:hypothetical protein
VASAEAEVCTKEFYMARPLSDRVEEAFRSSDQTDISQYLTWLRDSLSEQATQLRRNAIAMILLVAVFELVIESPNVQITLGIFKIYKGSVILIIIPALVSYLFLDAAASHAELKKSSIIFSNAFRKWSEDAEKNDLDLPLLPALPLYWTAGTTGYPDVQGRIGVVDKLLTNTISVVLSAAIIAFNVQAYYALYRPQHGNVLWLISVILTVLFLTGATLYYVVNKRVIRLDWS